MFSQLRKARGNAARDFDFRTLLVLSDGLAGNGEDLIDCLALEAGPRCAIVGGAAGDGGKFVETSVFLRGIILQDAIVVAEFLSQARFGVGVAHGWCPTRFQRRVTRVVGNSVLELHGEPAIRLYEEYAKEQGVTLTPETVNWFMMTHELGIQMPNGEIKIRAPLSATEDGGIICATEDPVGKMVSIVEGRKSDLLAAAGSATESAIKSMGDIAPAGVVVFDCVARKANLSTDFIEEVDVIQRISGKVPVIGSTPMERSLKSRASSPAFTTRRTSSLSFRAHEPHDHRNEPSEAGRPGPSQRTVDHVRRRRDGPPA